MVNVYVCVSVCVCVHFMWYIKSRYTQYPSKNISYNRSDHTNISTRVHKCEYIITEVYICIHIQTHIYIYIHSERERERERKRGREA